MTLLYHIKKPHHGWFVLILASLMINLPAVSQQSGAAAPMSADQVMERVVQMNDLRAKMLDSYSSVRTYHLECHCLSHKSADMAVRMNYLAPDRKEFSILSESGSGAVRDRVFRRLLAAEEESVRQENQQQSAITPENYTFRISEYEKTDSSEVYVLGAQPRSTNKFLFRGHIWVDANDFAIMRVEGEPAINPSWWTKKTDFKRNYEKIGAFWLPVSNKSVTKVRAFGTAILTIEYRDYQITQAGGATIAYSQQKPLSAQ